MPSLLFIPPLATKIKLTRDWPFRIKAASNHDAFRLLVPDEDPWKITTPYPVILPEGTVLSIERIYVRQGGGDYASVTFRVVDGPNKRLVGKKYGGTAGTKCRFWVSLDEVNDKLEFEPALGY